MRCGCGCGEQPPIATHTRASRGFKKGEPQRFVPGHQNRVRAYPRADLSRYEVQDQGYKTPCWIWTGSRSPDGYGRHGGTYAHTLLYEAHVGPVPEGQELDHLCRVPACCNPDHLEPVTHAENVRRAIGKLTREIVVEIRAATGPQREIARRFNVDPGRVSKIKRGLIWADV